MKPKLPGRGGYGLIGSSDATPIPRQLTSSENWGGRVGADGDINQNKADKEGPK